MLKDNRVMVLLYMYAGINVSHEKIDGIAAFSKVTIKVVHGRGWHSFELFVARPGFLTVLG